MRPEKDGFTMVELLTVLAIIAILVGILVPSLNYVRNTARAARQTAQFAAIDMALMAFKGDYGDYPPSYLDTRFGTGYYYCGANKLCEALLGWDLLGFHPDSDWRADGKDSSGMDLYQKGWDTDPDIAKKNLEERKGPYLELGTASAFRLNQLFPNPPTTALNLNTYVLCDSFGAKPVTITAAGKSKTVKAGRPILYYKADTSSKNFTYAGASTKWPLIYNYTDNIDLIKLKADSEKSNDPLYGSTSTPPGNFYWPGYYKLVDEKILDASGGKVLWPCRPDSYILISAGVDGLYGTQDDICNF